MQTHFNQLVEQLRTRNAIPSAASLVLGYSVVVPQVKATAAVLLAVLSVSCLMFFATLQNDITDLAQDNAGKRQAPLNKGGMQLAVVGAWAKIFLLTGIVLAGATQNSAVTLLLVAFAGLIWMYNRKPLQVSHRPILSIIALGLILSTVPFVAGLQLHGAAYDYVAVLLLVGLFLHRCSVSILKDYKDVKEDAAFGKRTFLIVYGARRTRSLSLVLAALGYGIVAGVTLAFVDDIFGYVALAVVIALAIYSLVLRLQLGASPQATKENAVRFQKIFNLSLSFDVVVLLCYLPTL